MGDRYLCTDPDCEMRGMWHMGTHIDAEGGEYIRVTPSPEMRAAVLAAAGIPDELADPFAGIPNARDEDNRPF